MNGITLVLKCAFYLCSPVVYALFIPPSLKKDLSTEDQIYPFKEKMTLQGILFRHDTQDWVVWIDGKRYDNKFLRSFNKWIIIAVNEESVCLQHESGLKQVLFLER